jgi:hypothetical protein
VGDKPLPEAGKVVDHRAYLLKAEISQKAAPKTELPLKLKKKQQTVIKHRQQSGRWNTTCTRERGGAKK